MKFKFRHADKIVGLFVLIALLMLAFMTVFAGVNKKWFTKKIHYTSLFTSAAGLREGMGVNLRGFEIGRVKDVSLNADNQVDLHFYVYETYHDRVKPDSVLVLPSGLFGAGAALDFYPGLSEGESLADGTFIPSTQTLEGKLLVKKRLVDRPDSGDPINEILNQLPDILEGIDTTLTLVGEAVRGVGDDVLSDTVRTVQRSAESLEVNLLNIEDLTGSLAALSSELEDPTGLLPTLLDPQGSLETMLNDDNALWDSLMGILTEVEGTATGLRELSMSLAGLSPQLALTLDELIRALEQSQKVMEGLRNNPLLRRGISEEAEPESSGVDWREEDF